MLREETREFFDKLAQLCNYYGVDVITAKDDEVKVVMDNSRVTVSFMQLKDGVFNGIEESIFSTTYHAEFGDEDDD